MTEPDLLARLQAMPDGARIGITWRLPGKNEGHTIACEKNSGKLIFVDPQNGAIGDAHSGVLGKASPTHGYSYYRMDKLELKNDFEWEQIVKKGTP